jgi:hypothetical protein
MHPIKINLILLLGIAMHVAIQVSIVSIVVKNLQDRKNGGCTRRNQFFLASKIEGPLLMKN